MRIITILLISIFLFACEKQETDLEHTEKHLNSTYICPMHPQIIKNEPGNCPICGMNLVKQVPIKQNTLAIIDKHLNSTYICPMHPQIIKNEPGNCPICGMNLVKQELKSTNLNQQANKDSVNQTITIRPEIIQRMGIRTTKVKRQVLQKIIKTVGYVTYNEDKMIHIHARSNGWVENLAVRREGDWVKRGQKLLEMYSHEILEAQQDFLVALRTTIKGTNLNRKEYRNSIRNRLRLLGIPDSTIKKIERKNTFINNIPIFAPQSGVITRFNIREGMYVTPGLEIFTIVDLSDIWIIAEVFEHQLAWVEKGLSAEITIPALPSKIFKGKIEFIYPELGIKTRTLKVRLGFNNPNGILKLNMFAQAVIHGKPKKNVLTIPQQALIVTGERKTVIRALSEGRFEPVEVKTGMRSQAKVEILSGLKVNDDIVLSGQFLIDSEANLQASFLRFSAVGKTEPLEHHH